MLVGWLVIWSLRTACSNKDYCSPVLYRQPALHHRHRTAPPSLVAFYDSPGELWAAEKFCGHPLSAEVKIARATARRLYMRALRADAIEDRAGLPRRCGACDVRRCAQSACPCEGGGTYWTTTPNALSDSPLSQRAAARLLVHAWRHRNYIWRVMASARA